MAGKDLKSIVERIVDLPTLPQVVTKIMALIEDPNSSAKEINDVMGNDPALVAKILKLVNSAFYALPNRVSSIQQAITILGFNTIKSLAISASVFDLFGGGEEAFSYEQFWMHSLGCATINDTLAKKARADKDTAFVIGLLHAMGRLVLDQYAPVEFQDILRKAQKENISFHDAEKEILETGYGEIGFWLSNKWKLAEEVQLSIAYQHDLENCPDAAKSFVAILAVSRYICRINGYDSPGDFNAPATPLDAIAILGLDEDELSALVEEGGQELERTSDFLNVVHS